MHRLLRTLSAASIRIRAHGPLYEVPVPLVVYIDLLRLNCMKKRLVKIYLTLKILLHILSPRNGNALSIGSQEIDWSVTCGLSAGKIPRRS